MTPQVPARRCPVCLLAVPRVWLCVPRPDCPIVRVGVANSSVRRPPPAGGDKQSHIPAAASQWVRYKYFSSPISSGKKRLVGASVARGTIVLLWSEHHVYSPDRVEAQVRPIINGVSQGGPPPPPPVSVTV